MNEKKIIGLTGTYCAGKNHVALILEEQGFPVLDVDKLGHRVIELEKERLITRFGDDILDPGGRINRKLLGKKVFGNPLELAALEEIVHPGINRECLAWIDEQKAGACVINAALLHRFSAFEILDAIIIVEAPFLVRLLRARKRDRLGWMVLWQRFSSQREFNSQYFRGNTDIYKVKNSGFFSFGKRWQRKKLESRMNEILSLKGITGV